MICLHIVMLFQVLIEQLYLQITILKTKKKRYFGCLKIDVTH